MVLGPERGTQTLEGVPSPHPTPALLPSFLHSFIRPPSVLCAEPILGVGCRGCFWFGGVQGYRGGRERGELPCPGSRASGRGAVWGEPSALRYCSPCGWAQGRREGVFEIEDGRQRLACPAHAHVYGLGGWPGHGWKRPGFEWGDSGVATPGAEGGREPGGLGGVVQGSASALAGVSCPCPGVPASGSPVTCSQREATWTCEQSSLRRTGPTVPGPSAPRDVHWIRKDREFGAHSSLGGALERGPRNPEHLQTQSYGQKGRCRAGGCGRGRGGVPDCRAG